MKINYNVTGSDRQRVVGIISKELNTKPVYTRMPECAYHIGSLTVTKGGELEWDERTDSATIQRITEAIAAAGFQADGDAGYQQIAQAPAQEAAQAAERPLPAKEAQEPEQDHHRTTEAQRKAVSAWVKSRDSIVLRVPKETGAEIRAAAKAAGMTVTAYILACVSRKAE